jgi:hypothetical protein
VAFGVVMGFTKYRDPKQYLVVVVVVVVMVVVVVVVVVVVQKERKKHQPNEIIISQKYISSQTDRQTHSLTHRRAVTQDQKSKQANKISRSRTGRRQCLPLYRLGTRM